jgi:hypothetical protein
MPPASLNLQLDVRVAIAAVIALALAGCSTQAAPLPTTSPTPVPDETPPSSAVIESNCGSTPIYRGSIPHWLDVAGGYNNPRELPYVIGHPALAAGFIFGYPLRAGHPDNPGNKILWVVKAPRNRSSLTVDAHPLGASSPAIHETFPANAGPGEIYPDGVDVPTAGCWQFDLRWGNNDVQVELNYKGS